MMSWLTRTASRPFVAVVFSLMTFEGIYFLLPVALASQGVSYSSLPSWMAPFLSWGLALIAAVSVGYGLGVPSRRAVAAAKRAKEDRELALRMENDELKAELKKLRAGQVVSSGGAAERDLTPEPTGADKREWYSKGRKVWEEI